MGARALIGYSPGPKGSYRCADKQLHEDNRATKRSLGIRPDTVKQRRVVAAPDIHGEQVSARGAHGLQRKSRGVLDAILLALSEPDSAQGENQLNDVRKH